MSVRGPLFPIAVSAMLAGLGLAGPAAAAEQRFMIGDSIFVGPDDTMEQVTCVACSIRVEGVVKQSAYLFLGRLENKGTIEGEAVVVAGTLESDGEIGGNSILVAGDMRLRGNVGGSAITVIGSVHADDPSARVGGDLVTIAGSQSGFPAGAVGGTISHMGGERLGRLMLSGMIALALLIVFGLFAILMTLNGITYFSLGTKRLETVAATFTGNSAACFLLGLGTCLALGVVGMIVAMLLPVSLPILLVLLLISVVGYCGLTFGIGRNLFPKLRPLAATQAAAALIILIQLVPVVGWLVTLVLWNVAIGAAVMSGFGSSTQWLTSRAELRQLPETQAG